MRSSILPWIFQWVIFSFLAGNVLSASLSILFAFYKICCCYKKKICICICKFEPGSCVFEGLIWDRTEMQMMWNHFPMMLSSLAFEKYCS